MRVESLRVTAYEFWSKPPPSFAILAHPPPPQPLPFPFSLARSLAPRTTSSLPCKCVCVRDPPPLHAYLDAPPPFSIKYAIGPTVCVFGSERCRERCLGFRV